MFEMKPKRNRKGMWYIYSNQGSWYSYVFSRCEIGKFTNYILYMKNVFGAEIQDSNLLFQTEEDTKKAIEYIESILVMMVLTE